MIQIFDCEQGSADWFSARLGIPTASEFSTVMAEARGDGTLPQPVIDAMVKSGCSAEQLAVAIKAAKKKNSSPAATRRQYMRTLAAEIIRGEMEVETYTNAHMERGKVMEDEARKFYAFIRDCEPQQVGFIRSGQAGCSPDSLVGDDGGLEIKTALGHIQIDRLQRGTLPPEHKAQVHGSMWITGRAWWDFVSYAPGLSPLIVRVDRDEAYIAEISSAVDQFNAELATMAEQVRQYGLPMAAAA